MNNEIIDKINIDAALKAKAAALVEKNEDGILRLSESFLSGKTKCLAFKSDLTRLAVALKSAERTFEKYKSLGIGEKIFFATMDDIGIWCENNANRGLRNYNWIKNHVCCEIFRIGRLQFQFYKAVNPTLQYDKLPFKFGDNLVYIHIPQGSRLILNDCIDSIKAAKAFFKRYFPEYKYDYFFCESWLLYRDNIKFMDENSNIIKFQSLFNIAYSLNYEKQAIERIFGKRKRIADCYAERTSLQKSAKKYIEQGGKFGMGVGYIKAE